MFFYIQYNKLILFYKKLIKYLIIIFDTDFLINNILIKFIFNFFFLLKNVLVFNNILFEKNIFLFYYIYLYIKFFYIILINFFNYLFLYLLILFLFIF